MAVFKRRAAGTARIGFLIIGTAILGGCAGGQGPLVHVGPPSSAIGATAPDAHPYPAAGFSAQPIQTLSVGLAEAERLELDFSLDRRGVGALDGRRARFGTVTYHENPETRDGFYASVGLGRDKAMREAHGRGLATKLVGGYRHQIREESEAFVEVRNVVGMGFDGPTRPEHQVGVGVRLRF